MKEIILEKGKKLYFASDNHLGAPTYKESREREVRFVIISLKATTIFGKLLVLGVGIPIVFQGFINMGVSVGLLPITGQNLPFFTTGGTSIWMTCIALGIVLSVSARTEVSSQ